MINSTHAVSFTSRFRYAPLISMLVPLLIHSNLQAGSLPAHGVEPETLLYLKGLSIEELLQTEVTSVSKKTEHLFNAAAAVSVITQEDLRRAGVDSIPEALRLVPGLMVADIDSSRRAIGSRGFNDYFANKLLVLIDGRSMYTPLYSGVFWNMLDTVIEDIDRIEVIRGPGATVWGANAVNGVINIITKDSANTQGGLISAIAGTSEQPLVSTRYGGKIDDKTTYRVYAKGFQRDSYEKPNGDDANDSWENVRTGFRADSRYTDKDTFSLQGEVFDGKMDASIFLSEFLTQPYPSIFEGTETSRGGHLLSTWNHSFSDTSSTDVQIYYDRSERDQVIAREERDTIDFEFKHHWDPASVHDIVWGAGYRYTSDDITNTYSTSFYPASRSSDLWSIFVQDDINLLPDTAWLTVGSKFEHNDYSGFEVQPSVRLRYQPTEKQMLWTAVSRAVRSPSRSDHDIQVNLATLTDGAGNLAVDRLLGNKDFVSEELTAYEVGYRWQAAETVSLDLATYYNVYDNLRSFGKGTPYYEFTPSPPHLVMPEYLVNGLEGDTYGFEIQGTWQATDKLKLFAGYSWIGFDLERKKGYESNDNITEEKIVPAHQVQLRSYLDLPHNVSLDTELYYVSEISYANTLQTETIDAYFRFDLRLGWKPSARYELSVGADNLFSASHKEFPNYSNIVSSEVPNQFWAKITYTF
jgi:iron complex outermembrane recepter protein